MVLAETERLLRQMEVSRMSTSAHWVIRVSTLVDMALAQGESHQVLTRKLQPSITRVMEQAVILMY